MTARGTASVSAAIPSLKLPPASLFHESISGNPNPPSASGRVGRAQRAPPSRRAGNGRARYARPTLHAYPPASFLLSAFSFTRPILGLEIRRPARYIRRCTFVRVCSLTTRQTFDGRCPVFYRCAYGSKRCQAPFVQSTPRAVPGKGSRHVLEPTFSNDAEVRGGS